MPPTASRPISAAFPSENLTIGTGVAIFHLASARVVLCYHTRDKYYFLPKGRKNANEDICRAAEREGFEESGYRNRLLPLPFKHRQTHPDEGRVEFATEPLWAEIMPVSSAVQYMLFWYAAETVPEGVEEEYAAAQARMGQSAAARLYRPPPPFPADLTLEQRIALDVEAGDGAERVYEPRRHEGTGVDEEELLYASYLLPIDEARRKLRGTVMEDVIRRGYEAIKLRKGMEESRST